MVKKDTECILGTDIFSKAGIGITGVPVAFPAHDTPSAITVVLDDSKPRDIPADTRKFEQMTSVQISSTLDSLNKEDPNYPVLYAVYLLKLQELIEKALDINANIEGFCNLPGAEVTIEVGNSRPVNRRQYRIEFQLQKIVDEQIQKWLETDTIVLSLVHSAWNNPLLVVPKRNSASEIVGWRVCIDPRPLNVLIPEVNYPLP